MYCIDVLLDGNKQKKFGKILGKNIIFIREGKISILE